MIIDRFYKFRELDYKIRSNGGIRTEYKFIYSDPNAKFEYNQIRNIRFRGPYTYIYSMDHWLLIICKSGIL